MNLNVNQNNLYMFLPSKVSWVAEMLAKDKNIDIVDAIKKVYSSNVYKKLEDESTKLWHLGPVDIYRKI